MEPIELARRRAAELHAQAVEMGEDPYDPYGFAEAEVLRQGFNVEPTSDDANLLDGARAVFLPEDGLILHEDRGTAFEQAFLIAHELGHLVLEDPHDASTAWTVEPDRSAELSPVGLGRVVDYGPRQRREVQMDLFAREFLLPRELMRRLHLEEALPAEEIARRFGAPSEVVAQQLLDALLLPPVAEEADENLVDYPLNPEQQHAAWHRGAPYLLEAGPGTGKTQTLTGRIASLLDEGEEPRSLLVLTFSNKAAREMAARIARKRPQAAAAMWIGTFHAFGLDLVFRFFAELGFAKEPRLLEREDAAVLLEDRFPRLNFEHYRNLYDPLPTILNILDAIAFAKEIGVDAELYAEQAEQMLQRADSEETRKRAQCAQEEAVLYACYEQLKREAQAVDFGDLVLLSVKLLESHPEIAAQLQESYRHILVDEYQDVNRSSVRLLKALRPAGENIWAVGDARQSIYRFRGASAANMERFAVEDFPGAVLGRLKLNYRAQEEIVEAFSAFAQEMNVSRGESWLEAERGPCGEPPEHCSVPDQEALPGVLAEEVEALRRRGFSYRQQAILCTGNKRMPDLAEALEKRNVPVLYLGNLFERLEIKVLLALLSMVVDPRGAGLLRVACLPKFAMVIEDVETVLAYVRASGVAWQIAAEQDIPGLSAEGAQALRHLAEVLEGFTAGTPPWQILTAFLFDRTRLAAALAGSTRISDRSRAIAYWQFLNFVRAQPVTPGLSPVRSLLERIRHLVKLGNERELRQCPAVAEGLDAVRLMTIHNAKGLEFPVIHVPGLNEGTLPRPYSAPSCPPLEGMFGDEQTISEVLEREHVEEQECLFYVAASRARDRLRLYSLERNAAGWDRTVSAFVQRLGSAVKQRNVSPSHRIQARPLQTLGLLSQTGKSFSESQLALYQLCPRQFYYTHVLGIGGRRTTTPYLLMHHAVRVALESLIQGKLADTRPEALQARLAQACQALGLTTHGYAADYQAMAWNLLQTFLRSRQGWTPETPQALIFELGRERIRVQPDESLVDQQTGRRVLRRILTGHRRDEDFEDVRTLALVEAARKLPDTDVELVFLADDVIERVSSETLQVSRRLGKVKNSLNAIRAGRFPRKLSERCPGCPAFFVCGPLPEASARKKV